MNESILNHLFLPHYLPSSVDNDFLTKSNHKYEYKILECMEEYLNDPQSVDETNKLPIFQVLIDCIKHWSVLQDPDNFSETIAQSIIEQLSPGSFFPLYFHFQNAAVLIEIEENNIDQPLISSWKVLLSPSEIVPSIVPHLSCFPVTTYRLHHRSQLSCKAHCELLRNFMRETIEHHKSDKGFRQFKETRDVSESHYVCQWWIQQFQGIEINNNLNTSIQFKKKHRDQIRYNKGLPFRRSGLWMTIKVVFHTILTKRLGQAGIIVYKLLVTDFLRHVIYKTYRNISIDLLVHCIRKIVRRLNKIDGLHSCIDSDDVAQWVKHTIKKIQTNINEIIPKSNWQKSIHMQEQANNKLLVIDFELNHSEICQHLFQELNTYLNKQKSNKTSELSSDIKTYNDSVNGNQANYIPSINELTKTFNCTNGIALMRIEIWVELCLEQWINRPTASENEKNRFEILSDFFTDYQSIALKHYYSTTIPTGPMDYSRFILTCLTIIHSMHKKLCNDPRFERLKQHSIHIPNLLNLFEFLILPNRDDMIRARDLYDYFSEFNQKQYPDLLEKITSVDAFGVYYASQSSTMIDNLEKIKAQTELDKQQKIQEVENAKTKYTNLMNSIKDLSCTCKYRHKYHNRYCIERCNKCQIREQAEGIRVDIYECPLPSKHESALAVIFELQMPIEIRIYRDIIWQFINRPNPCPAHGMEEWLYVPPCSSKLQPFNSGSWNHKVKLVSSVKSVTQTHYSHPQSVASTSVKDFLYENGLRVQISPNKSIKFEDECRILTPQLDHQDYKPLQIAVDNTEFVQNQVIAKLSDCSVRLNPTQFVEFGSFRSGHRLQWWNLLAILEMDSLFIGEESVAILIIHSILQYGPLATDRNEIFDSWCSESHEQLLYDRFVDEFIIRLDRHLDNCGLNWQNELVLMVITMITMRILTICDLTRDIRVVELAMKCRSIGEKWIICISKNIQKISSNFEEVVKLRLKMINIGISCVLTFSTNRARIDYLLSSNKHIVSYLKAATTIRDNIILNTNQLNTSSFVKNMMKLSERVLFTLQPKLAEFLQKTSYQGLNDFVTIYWSVIQNKDTIDIKWKKRKEDIYDSWYDCQYESRYLSIDCLEGSFLVDEMTIGFLPSNITNNELFIRVFDKYVFEVQLAESPKTYITKNTYHGDEKVQYEFHFNDQIKHLLIKEHHIQTRSIFQLIPHSCFNTELPDIFISNYSHWWNEKDQIIEFRPIHFTDSDFLNKKPYVLFMTTGYVTTTETINKQILVNQSSILFQSLFNRYFVRLDNKPYVCMMCDNSSQSDIIIHIHLTRLGITFKYNNRTKMITSREYLDMCIDEDQWLGTLTGLTSGLLLSPLLSVNNYELKYYPYRKLIIPFGTIQGRRNEEMNHQIVTINRSSSLSQHYFVFILNDRLKIVQSTDSPTGWLYLSLLHAMTSHPLPDEYTEITGMERAFQLLNSAGCWSDQPFNQLSLNILGQIASISPMVNYHPKELTCMEQIEWNSNGLPYSMQHFGYYLMAKKLIDASQLFYFMYPSMISNEMPKIFQDARYNQILLEKLYWKYRDSYNPSVRLSEEMENDILQTNSTILLKQTSKNDSQVTNYEVVRLVDDLYSYGDVNLKDCSNLNWLPLSQWLIEGQWKTSWIGLLQLADRFKTEANGKITDDIQRFECLLNFLHYISDKCQIKPYYLQMLKTTLKVSNISFISLTFPPFISYVNINEISIVETRIPRGKRCARCQKTLILAEVERCWKENCEYPNVDDIATFTEKDDINKLLNSWRANKNLRLFLEDAQNLICSVPIEEFHNKVSYIPQEFSQEFFKDHHQIQFKPSNKLINQILLSNAEQKFHHFNSDYFNKKPILSVQTVDQHNVFPQEIFSSINDQDNRLREIKIYFQTQLAESWNKFLLDKQYEKECPSIEQIIELLNSLREESTKFWDEFIESVTVSHKQLCEIGLLTRITPSNLICLLQEKNSNSLSFVLTKDQHTLLGGILVNWTLEQQMERALHFANHQKLDDFKKEISHIPHSNWIPSENISWLILELEMNITIRENQIKVANHMIKPNLTTDNSTTTQSIVMQMNMGEGKTSVILPMLSVSLSSSNSSLVRIIVLKSLFPTNHQSLRYKLGGLLNRRIFPFVCRRDFNFTIEQIKQIHSRFKQGLINCDIILTSPEDILSFDLLTIDKCRREEFDVGRCMLTIQRELKKFVRDILDESDEILHVKYQLVYTVGCQQQLDGGTERWKTIQTILNLVKKHAEDISKCFNDEVYYISSKRKSEFPQFRLQSHKPFRLLCEKVANDWINSKLYCYEDKQIILSFILEKNSSVEYLEKKFSYNNIELFLIVRGLLLSEVLLFAFKKRYPVNYGINPNTACKYLMAVPFRAKDVAADKTEFGHPDVALVLTHLTYYYKGLNHDQLVQCFDRLDREEINPSSIYDDWISSDNEDEIPPSLLQWKGVNLKDYEQRTKYLFPTFRYNMLVVNYFLNYFVFPQTAKQFPYKLVSSAWDLSSSIRSQIITGFSGTNDTQLLLPVHIRQHDLDELQKTDAIVVNNLLKSENEYYQFLPIDATSGNILNKIVNYNETINVILDVGALFIHGTNRQIAMEWLDLSNKNKIDYVIYFDSDSIFVCDRQLNHQPFVTSPANERLDHCIFYLDEIHTRGTDFKFPIGFKAALTLGNGLTKDRFAQAAMRMRKLGNGHSLTFWSSYEVHQQIIQLKPLNNQQETINVIDILRWVYENTQQATWDGLHYWASQSLTFQRKISAFQNVQWNDDKQVFTNTLMEQLATQCLEPETIELKLMYGAARISQTLFEIHSARYDQSNHHLLTDIQQEVLKRLKDYGGTKQRLAQLLDEEQQKELQQELEEQRQIKRPPRVTPCKPILHTAINRLCDTGDTMLPLDKLPGFLRRLPYSFTGTTFFKDCQPKSWQENFWVSTEFQRVIETKGESLNPFLRPPRWIIFYRNQHIIFLTASEANFLIGRLKSLYRKQHSNSPPVTTIHLLLPRIKRAQSIFVNTPTLTIPPSIGLPPIRLEYLVQLFVFNGSLYFESVDEQTAYCKCLGLYPRPRTIKEEEAFAKGWIDVDGFVSNPFHRYYLDNQIDRARFDSNPLSFIKQLIENRNNSHAPTSSDVGSIIFNSLKLVE